MWLSKGDRKSKYFYQKASSQRQKNKVQKLQDDNGKWKESPQLDDLIVEHFRSMFSTSRLEGNMNFFEPLGSQITEEMNADFLSNFTRDEVFKAL